MGLIAEYLIIFFMICSVSSFMIAVIILIYSTIKSEEFLKYVPKDFFETKIHIIKRAGKIYYNQRNNSNMHKWIISDCDIDNKPLHELKLKFRKLETKIAIFVGLFGLFIALILLTIYIMTKFVPRNYEFILL